MSVLIKFAEKFSSVNKPASKFINIIIMINLYKICTVIKKPGMPVLSEVCKIPAFIVLLVFLMSLSLSVSLTGYTAGNFSAVNTTEVQPDGNKQTYLYYFYFVPRCDECLVLDKALEELLEKHYRKELENGQLVFKRINLSEPERADEAIIRDLRVRRQLLLLVSDDDRINLTRDAFRFVERDPERFMQSVMNPLNGLLR